MVLKQILGLSLFQRAMGPAVKRLDNVKGCAEQLGENGRMQTGHWEGTADYERACSSSCTLQ